MKPLNDFAFDSRQALIHGPESRRRHYQRCIDRGMSEFDAARMSGYHPIDELDHPFGRVVMAIILFATIAILALASSDVFADDGLISVETVKIISYYWATVGVVYAAYALYDIWTHRND